MAVTCDRQPSWLAISLRVQPSRLNATAFASLLCLANNLSLENDMISLIRRWRRKPISGRSATIDFNARPPESLNWKVSLFGGTRRDLR